MLPPRALVPAVCAALGLLATARSQIPPTPTPSPALQSFPGARWVDAQWADGDSFPVLLPGGRQITVRLYGADCMETHIATDSDARRLRAQRRYFGLPADDPAAAIARAKEHGARAAARTRELLARPFTVHTAFADARGDGRFPRVYAFIETAEGRDLASQLVEEGLARAFGVYRATPGGLSAEAYREELKDLELTAAAGRRGIWGDTDWARLPEERRSQRAEDAEIAIATGPATPPPRSLNPNTASRDELMRLPGVGESLANRIIENRAGGTYRSAADLARVPGIGPALIKKIEPFLVFP